MPFLRRRGVMASESDMRRHTTLFDPKRPADAFLAPGSAGHRLDNGAASQGSDGGRLSTDPNLSPIPSLHADADADADTDADAGADALMEADADAARPSQDSYARPDSPPVQDETPRHRRFSMLRFRNASDSQLSARWRQQQQQQQQAAEKPPPMPEPPAIITTAPTVNSLGKGTFGKKSGVRLPSRMRRSIDVPTNSQSRAARPKISSGTKPEKNIAMNRRAESPTSKHTVKFEEPSRTAPTSSVSVISEDHGSAMTAPALRPSESSRSDNGSTDHIAHNQHSTGSGLFRFGRRRQKLPEPLFPLAHLPQQSKTPTLSVTSSNAPSLPRDSTSTTHIVDAPRPSTGHDRSTPLGSPSHGLSGLVHKMAGSPATALFRPSSRNSGQSSPTRANLGPRGRSSTISSLGESFVDSQHPGLPRTSSSTGRKSFGDLLGLGRMRQNTDLSRHGTLTPATPGSGTSKNNSLQLTREPVALPERREDDTPAKYLTRVEGMLTRGVIASALSKHTDPFYAAVLRSYMRSFSFFEEPMDMAIRKLLMEAELPKETQQIDRCLQAFSNRYHECNPGIYATPDQAYFIAFSLLILHTDVFNKNNRYKMQKADYLKNTHGEGIFDDVLECFYDNISYTPFIHLEDEVHINGDRTGSVRSKKKTAVFPVAIAEPTRRSRDLLDPYTLILDGKLDILRPPLKDQIPLEEHYSYLGTANRLYLKELQEAFFKTGVLQIVSLRSRPDAFMTEKTQNNPDAAHPGIVDIKVTKVGLLWRKEATKRRTRSPWQEWGAILTGAQLYFFRNAGWVKNLLHQHEAHLKSGHDGVPLIFKPPLDHFKPDALMSTEGAVALWDSNYKKHKNAFVYIRHGGLEEVLLAQSEEDRNDWLAKLNYAAAFRTSGVRMRGVVGGNYEGQNRRAIRRLDSAGATQLIQTPTGQVAINRSKIDHQMARDILLARRTMMRQKIEEAEEKLEVAQKHLETQLRNARHLLVLAPIQERTREQVCNGAAKIIAQLRWSRIDFWKLKCHRDILAMDLAEDKEMNGDIRADLDSHTTPPDTEVNDDMPHQTQKLPTSQTLPQSSDLNGQPEDESMSHDIFHTPPTSATAPGFEDGPQPRFGPSGTKRASVSSIASSSKPTSAPYSHDASASLRPPASNNLLSEDSVEDEHERHVLEQAGLLEKESIPTNRRPSSAYTTDDMPDGKRGSIGGTDKDQPDKGKVRRSLQRTLRDGAGHLSHHRSKKGKDSVSTGGLSDDSIRDEVLFRGTGSFTVHGKKASVINFGNELQGITTDEHLRHRKQAQQSDEPESVSPGSADDDFHSLLGRVHQHSGRRGSATSASTATARSFRDLHRKYSSRASKSVAGGNLVVPSDEDSDAALSFSDGRRSPLPPLDDDEDENPTLEASVPSRFYTPDPPSSPTQKGSALDPEEETEEASRFHFSAVQEVSA
ncbi:hypothetical protein F4777DRAFT_519009 [Nemania sp. FL0916]|nr:hypothetical protein F4777DRAFT_519009 [Nemania sp. FL0916]